MSILSHVLDQASGYMPHGHWYLWQTDLLAAHVASDAIIFGSYLAISLTAVMIVVRIREVPFHGIYFLFGAFIFACGLTHAMEILNIWVPAYWLAATVKMITAVASLGTAVALPFYFAQIRAIAQAPGAAERERQLWETVVQQAQEQLIQSAKMASLGEMAGGMAHEIKNPLAIIRGKAGQLRHDVESGKFDQEKFRAHLQTLDKTVIRIDRIINSMRTFCREGRDDPYEALALTKVIEDSVALCAERFAMAGVELRTNVSTTVAVECRLVQISQIIINLLSNAFDAVHALPQPWVEISAEVLADGALIHVTDCGPNIAPDVAARIMQPFFTTKPAGKGTGLGLSISRGLARLHHGDLLHASAHPTTRFTLQLPLTQPVEADLPKEQAA